MDEDIKKHADALFSDLGLRRSTDFNIILRQALRKQQIPFTISSNIPNPVTLAAMGAAERDEDMYVPFGNGKKLMETLNA